MDAWLRQRAWKGQIVGNATVYVFEHHGSVLGFYAITAGGVEHLNAPGEVRRNAPNPIPVLLVARLGVDVKAQGRKLGRLLLQDALLRAIQISETIGFRALLIHCRDETARDFYMHAVPSFQPSPTDALHLFMPLDALRRAGESPS